MPARSSTSVNDFLRGFEHEPVDISLRAAEPPPTPQSTTIRADSILNYRTLQGNDPNVYGATAVMLVSSTVRDPYYGDIPPGTIFLFPGTWAPPSRPPYRGQGLLELRGKNRGPLNRDDGETWTLHRQLCENLLGMPTTNFIGFGVSYPWYQPGNISYNSGTCNEYWFGDRALPSIFQDVVNAALVNHLPGGTLLGAQTYSFAQPSSPSSEKKDSRVLDYPAGTVLAYPILTKFDLDHGDKQQYGFGREQVSLDIIGSPSDEGSSVACTWVLRDDTVNKRAYAATATATVLFRGERVQRLTEDDLHVQEVQFSFPASQVTERTADVRILRPAGTESDLKAEVLLEGFNLLYTDNNEYGFGRQSIAFRIELYDYGFPGAAVYCTAALRDDTLNKRRWEGEVRAVVIFSRISAPLALAPAADPGGSELTPPDSGQGGAARTSATSRTGTVTVRDEATEEGGPGLSSASTALSRGEQSANTDGFSLQEVRFPFYKGINFQISTQKISRPAEVNADVLLKGFDLMYSYQRQFGFGAQGVELEVSLPETGPDAGKAVVECTATLRDDTFYSNRTWEGSATAVVLFRRTVSPPGLR